MFTSEGLISKNRFPEAEGMCILDFNGFFQMSFPKGLCLHTLDGLLSCVLVHTAHHHPFKGLTA